LGLGFLQGWGGEQIGGREKIPISV